MRTMTGTSPLVVELVRGGVVESIHRVSMAMVDVEGALHLGFGDLLQPTFMRSSAKPFQAIPFVEAGYHTLFELNEDQVAVLCASHSGTDDHLMLVQDILGKAGYAEGALQCGTHTPFDRETAKRLLREGESPGTLRHNCSGKHAGMILYTHAASEDPQAYLNPESKVQREILQTLSAMVDLPTEDIAVGIDGCSAPNFAVPLPAAALGYARLMDPAELIDRRAEACRHIVRAMVNHPMMVGGPRRFDTALMQTVERRLLSKGGAEGYQAIGVPSGEGPLGKAFGITLKVHDGDLGKRALAVVTLAVLGSLGLLTAGEREQLASFDTRPMKNFRELTVGEIRLSEDSTDRLSKAYERI